MRQIQQVPRSRLKMIIQIDNRKENTTLLAAVSVAVKYRVWSTILVNLVDLLLSNR